MDSHGRFMILFPIWWNVSTNLRGRRLADFQCTQFWCQLALVPLSWWGSHLGPEHGQSADSSMRCWCRDHGESCSERYKAVWTDGIRKQSYWHKIGTSTGIELLCVCIYIQIYIYMYIFIIIYILYYISIDNIYMLLTHRYWWCTANVIVSDRRTHPLRMIQNCAEQQWLTYTPLSLGQYGLQQPKISKMLMNFATNPTNPII